MIKEASGLERMAKEASMAGTIELCSALAQITAASAGLNIYSGS